MNDGLPRIAAILSAPFGENTYVASLPGRNDCLVVDPGLEPEKIIEYLDEQGLTPAALMITHGHPDHIGGNFALKERWPDCPLVIGGQEPGREILYPVATVILGGLVTSTFCEFLIHPGLFWRFSGRDAEQLVRAERQEDAELMDRPAESPAVMAGERS